MTIAPVNTSILSELVDGGGMEQDIAMMIGISVVKNSDAVFFQYLGDDKEPQALMNPRSGKPITTLPHMRLVGISIAEDVGTFNLTKLNLFLEATAGSVVMLTSGLTTLWSQSVIIALSGLYQTYDLSTPFSLNSWKGTVGLRPTFASIKIGKEKITDQMLYDQLKELRADKAADKITAVMRDSVEILSAALGGGDVDAVDVQVEETESLSGHPDF
tara:strand:+ start:1057 stop:1704 length:648 start_codon:yes stop_codon:yes gene_type:complete